MTKLYAILDTRALQHKNVSLSAAARAILAEGATLIQIRHKEYWSRQTFAEAETVAGLCSKHNAQLVVNDRADFAMLLHAGLHVGQDDLAPSAARDLLGAEKVIGFSTHNEAQMAAASTEPVTYVALGPIFGTVNKENPDAVVGLENLRAWRKLVHQPLVAIGGITRLNALSVLEAGADSVAVIGDLLPAICDEYSLRERFASWQRLLNQ